MKDNELIEELNDILNGLKIEKAFLEDKVSDLDYIVESLKHEIEQKSQELKDMHDSYDALMETLVERETECVELHNQLSIEEDKNTQLLIELLKAQEELEQLKESIYKINNNNNSALQHTKVLNL